MIQFDFTRAEMQPNIAEPSLPKGAGFLDLPGQNLIALQKTARQVAKQFENLVVIGIGGSSLGLKCLINALLPATYNLHSLPRIFVLENPDSASVNNLLKFLNLSKTCFNVVSKSGATLETLSLWNIFHQQLKKKLGKKWTQHVVITTDPLIGPLREFARKNNLISFDVPPNVGGRFSVLSPVGLFPAACVGIDVKALLRGAATAMKNKKAIYQNAALHYYAATQKGKTISVMMPYRDGLKSFADWVGQLWAESLGKTDQAQTPVSSLGPADQHSQLQLYCGGPKNKIVTFIKVAAQKNSLDKLLNAECDATAQSLAEVGCPSVTLTLPKLDAASLGELLMSYQLQTAFAGPLFGVNPYDQPDVERSKELTRDHLRR